MPAITIPGFMGRIDPDTLDALEARISYNKEAELVISPRRNIPNSGKPVAEAAVAACAEAEPPQTFDVVFCLAPVFGHQPFVFDHTTLCTSHQGFSDRSVRLTGIKLGKPAAWDTDIRARSVGGQQTDAELEWATSFCPPVGWNVSGTALALTYSLNWTGSAIRIKWLELYSR